MNRRRIVVRTVIGGVLMVLAVLLPAVTTRPVTATATATWHPTARAAPLSGPMRGLYQWRGMQIAPHANDATAYERYVWRDLATRTASGGYRYDFSLIDADLAAADHAGQQFAFRIQAVTDDPRSVPDGFPGRWCDGVYVPDWNSPTFVREARALVTALGDRYDGDPRIAWVEIGLYGRWAEWHTYGLCGDAATTATWKAVVDMHLQAFPTTRLIMLSDHPAALVYALGKSPRIGWRRDSWGHPHFAAIRDDPATWAIVRDRWKTAPVIVEAWPPPNLALGIQQIQAYHISLVGNGNLLQGWQQLSASDQQSLLTAGRTAGSLPRPLQITYPLVFEHGRAATLTSVWQNAGVAPAYVPWRIEYQLRRGSTIVARSPSHLNLETLLPTDRATFSDGWTISDQVPTGTYDLVLLVTDPQGQRAPLDLAITDRRADGSYRLGSVRLQRPDTPQPTTMTLTPIKDTFVRDGDAATTTFGDDPTLAVKAGDPGYRRVSYLQFDLAPLEAVSAQRATLHLYVPPDGLSQGSVTVAVFGVGDDRWPEALRWAQQPWLVPRYQLALQDRVVITTSGWQDVDVTPMIQSELAQGYRYPSLVLLADTPQRLLTLGSRESAMPPRLIVQTASYGTRLLDEWRSRSAPLYLPLVTR